MNDNSYAVFNMAGEYVPEVCTITYIKSNQISLFQAKRPTITETDIQKQAQTDRNNMIIVGVPS